MKPIVHGPAAHAHARAHARALALLASAAFALSLGAGLLGAAPPAHAVQAVDAPDAAPASPGGAVRSSGSGSPGVAAPGVAALQSAVIASVDVARATFVVHGRTLALHPNARIVDAAGRAVGGGAAALRPGDAVRLALEPETSPPVGRRAASAGAPSAPRRVVLVYLHAR